MFELSMETPIGSQAEAGFIPEKPNPRMRLSIIIPVLAEYENGNIFRLLESFTRQTADKSDYELIFVVNNTQEAARQNSPGYQDNQSTLQIGKFLHGEIELPEGLNEHRQKVLERAKEIGMAIHMVDLSTNGFEKNIGMVRDLGLNEALSRFQLNGQNGEGLVAQLDADSAVESHYVENILKHFDNSPQTESLFLTLDYFTPEGSQELFQTSFNHQYKIAFDQWLNTLRHGAVEVGGPQTVARIKAYKRVGGVRHQDMAEDFRLSESLSQETNYQFGTDVRVYTSDRARAESYDGRIRLERMTEENGKYNFSGDMIYGSPKISFLRRELEHLAKQDPTKFNSEAEVKKLFDKYKIDFNYQKFREFVVDKKTSDGKIRPLNQKVALYLGGYIEAMGIKADAPSNQYVDEAIEFFKDQLAPAEFAIFNATLRKNRLRGFLRLAENRDIISQVLDLVYQESRVLAPDDLRFNAKCEEFLQRNPWLLSELNRLKTVHKNKSEAIEALKQQYPEYTELFENSRLRRSTALLQGLTMFCREARNNPDEFPTTIQLLNKLTG